MVMFRDFVLKRANAIGVTGKVENLSDGTVRVQAEGEKEKLESFLAELKLGPSSALVESVLVSWVNPTDSFADFSIRFS